MALIHDTSFDPAHGMAVEVAPGVRRLTAGNPGPFTFKGTNTYLVGETEVVVIDPGPADRDHVAAIVAAAGRSRIAAIAVSHTHRDHSPGARMLQDLTGAPVYGEGPHRPSRDLNIGEHNPLDGSGDAAFVPDHRLRTGDAITVGETRLVSLATPGHCANHLCFALGDSGILFSADHVMAWSTSIVAPPDGSMADYMHSLEILLQRQDTVYFPGHGGPIRDPANYVAALKSHRLGRENAILDRIAAGTGNIPEMVRAIYRDLDPRLYPAAALSALAHLEDLVSRGLVVCDGPPSLNARYRLART